MNKLKLFFGEKSVSYILRLIGVVISVLSLVMLGVEESAAITRHDANATNYITIFVLTGIGILIQAVSLIKKAWPLKYFPIVLYLASIIVFLKAEITLIGQVVMSIDGTMFHVPWMLYVVFWLIAVVLCICTMVMRERKRKTAA